MSSNSNSPKPRLACEIAADRVLVGRLAADGHTLEASAAHELAPGSVVPDLVESNLLQRDPVVSAVRETLNSVGGRTHDVIAVVPDAAVRVVLLEFDTLPSDSEEASGVVRFRMKKSLPFDVDKARVSYHAQKTAEGVRVVAAVALASVVEDYEAVIRDAGFSPGVVIPSMLAALGAAEAERPTLVVKVDARTTSIAILNAGQLQLFRTLENTRGVTITGDQLAEEVYPSVVFFQDTYHLNIEKIFVAGLADTGSAAPALRSQTGAEVQELVRPSQLGVSPGGSVPRWRLAGFRSSDSWSGFRQIC
jgi:type IV pilus assembly protein PilM